MKYKDLIERFKPYENEEVSMFFGYSIEKQIYTVDFGTVRDDDLCIIILTHDDREPYKAREVRVER